MSSCTSCTIKIFNLVQDVYCNLAQDVIIYNQVKGKATQRTQHGEALQPLWEFGSGKEITKPQAGALASTSRKNRLEAKKNYSNLIIALHVDNLKAD